jgi:Protein of unknown function (DUF2934)
MATRKTPSKTAAKSASKAAGRTTSRTRAESGVTPPRAEVVPAASPATVSERSAAPQGDAAKAPSAPISAEARYRWIALAAYWRAERRGFAPGHEIEDWLAAEADFVAAHKPAQC